MKKKAERWYLERFLESRSDFIVGDIKDHEAPDFLCLLNGEMMGIEVTSYFAPPGNHPPPQAVENDRRKLSDSLGERSILARIPRGHYSVFFTRNDIGMSRKQRQIREDLIGFAALMGCPSEAKEFDYSVLPSSIQASGIDQINFYPNSSIDPFWSFPAAFPVHRTTTKDIQNTIREKNDKLVRYRESVPTVWLLIVGASAGVGSHLNPDKIIFSHSYSFEFDRVFVFDALDKKSFELLQSDAES